MGTPPNSHAKHNTENILITFGKTELDKFELQRNNLSEEILALYGTTETYRGGKWIWIPIDEKLSSDNN